VTTRPQMITLDETDPYERGRERGLAIRDSLADGIVIYLELFAATGISRADVVAGAELAVRATEAWSPALAAEMRGTADGAGVPLWQVAALNARTEILSGARGAKPGECSTIVNASSRPVGAQTWDWHDELRGYWHLQRVTGTQRSFVGLTEHGILGKIGMNDAGIGVLFNILGHQSDRADGVPVHLVSARVLAEASTLDEAIAILSEAPVSTSSAITVLSPDGAVIVELSPVGAKVVRAVDGVLLHTNHFLNADLATGEKPGLYDPDSQLRLGMLEKRVAAKALPLAAEGLVDYLVSGPDDVAQLCCIPEPGATLGDRWATLATVTLDATSRTMTVSAGSPAEVTADSVIRLTAGGDIR